MTSSTDQIRTLEEAVAAAAGEHDRLTAQIALAAALTRHDAGRSVALAVEAYRDAGRLGDRSLQAGALLAEGSAMETQGRYDVALERLAAALEIYRAIGERRGEANTLNAHGIVYGSSSNYTAALDAFRGAIELFDPLDDPARLAAFFNNLGSSYYALAAYDQSLTAYLDALRIYEEEGDERGMAVTLGNIGSIHYYLGDNALSLDFCRRALEIVERIGPPYSRGYQLGNISSLYKATGDLDGAEAALRESIEIFREIGDERLEATAWVKLGMIEDLRGRKGAGLKACLKGAAIQKRIGALGDYADSMLRIGTMHLAKDRVAEGLEALRASLEAAVDASIAKTESEIHEALAGAYERVGEFEKAYHHLRRHAALAADLLGAERSRIVAEMGARFDLERAERERELFRERSRHLEELADQRSRQLTAAATHLVKKNSLLGELHHDLSRLGERQEPSRAAVNALLRRIEESLRSEEDWRRFEETYSLVHHDFLQTLSQSFPDLSAMELKICALLKMSLSNKEIADILSISVRTIESHRYRIRKKLGLGNEANLAAHIAGM